ncbi:MAG: hypothetical protein RIC95_01595 [Vicingaceae bacterium]
MSDQIQEFDRVFREKLSGQATPPPESVWDNIEKERTYGHVVANRISNYWQQFGTMLLLLIGGAAAMLFVGGGEQQIEHKSQAQVSQPAEKAMAEYSYFPNLKLRSTAKQTKIAQQHSQLSSNSNQKQPTYTDSKSKVASKVNLQALYEGDIPDGELIASLGQSAFARPQLKDDRLNAQINHREGWESAKPFGFVHYYQMDESPLRPFRNEIAQAEMKSAGDVKHEYFDDLFEHRTFRERSYLYFAFTPQTVQKIMTPEFNLSSDYLKDRSKAENTRLAYTFTAGLHYELKNHKFFETGINFTQIYEEMSLYGEKRFSNQYDFIEIPLLLGYKDRNAKWGWHIKGGLGVQVYNNYKGYILKKVADPNDPVQIAQPNVNQANSNAQFRMKKTDAVVNIITNDHALSDKQDRRGVLDLSRENENPYLESGVVNFHMAAGITYYHSIRTSFTMTPHYSRSINSITKDRALFKERISYMGISFGTLVKF